MRYIFDETPLGAPHYPSRTFAQVRKRLNNQDKSLTARPRTSFGVHCRALEANTFVGHNVGLNAHIIKL